MADLARLVAATVLIGAGTGGDARARQWSAVLLRAATVVMPGIVVIGLVDLTRDVAALT